MSATIASNRSLLDGTYFDDDPGAYYKGLLTESRKRYHRRLVRRVQSTRLIHKFKYHVRSHNNR